MLLLSIFTTTLYTAKIFSKVFFGESTLHLDNELKTKENDSEMLMPLVILTIPSVFLGIFIYDSLMLGTLFGTSLAAQELVVSFYNEYAINSLNFFLHSFLTINFLILLLAIIFGYFYYYKKSFEIKMPFFIKNILIGEFGFKIFSSKYIPELQNFITKSLRRRVDVSAIDNGFVNNTSYFLNKISHKVRKAHTGFIYHYSLTIISALILLLLIIGYKN